VPGGGCAGDLSCGFFSSHGDRSCPLYSPTYWLRVYPPYRRAPVPSGRGRLRRSGPPRPGTDRPARHGKADACPVRPYERATPFGAEATARGGHGRQGTNMARPGDGVDSGPLPGTGRQSTALRSSGPCWRPTRGVRPPTVRPSPVWTPVIPAASTAKWQLVRRWCWSRTHVLVSFS
jgi:hypothetical protein